MMKKGVWISLMAGLLLAIILFAYSGIGKIGEAIAAAGWMGVTLMAMVHMLPVILCAVAWRLVSPPESVPGFGVFVRARWVRDAVGEMWITPPLGSELAGMRILTMAGMDQPQAAAATLVDLTEALAHHLLYPRLPDYWLPPPPSVVSPMRRMPACCCGLKLWYHSGPAAGWSRFASPCKAFMRLQSVYIIAEARC